MRESEGGYGREMHLTATATAAPMMMTTMTAATLLLLLSSLSSYSLLSSPRFRSLLSSLALSLSPLFLMTRLGRVWDAGTASRRSNETRTGVQLTTYAVCTSLSLSLFSHKRHVREWGSRRWRGRMRVCVYVRVHACMCVRE